MADVDEADVALDMETEGGDGGDEDCESDDGDAASEESVSVESEDRGDCAEIPRDSPEVAGAAAAGDMTEAGPSEDAAYSANYAAEQQSAAQGAARATRKSKTEEDCRAEAATLSSPPEEPAPKPAATSTC